MLKRLMWEILRPILIGQRKPIKLLFEDNKAGVTAMVAGMTGVGGRGVPDANGFTNPWHDVDVLDNGGYRGDVVMFE